jgi:hypothetical protein
MASYEASNTPRQHDEYLQRKNQAHNNYSNDNTPRHQDNQLQNYQQKNNGVQDSNRDQNYSEFMKHNPNQDFQQQKKLIA